MAPAALLSSAPVQSLCPSCRITKKWQSKRVVSSGLALTRASSHGNIDKASVKSSMSLRPLESVFGRRRRSGVGSETGSCSSRHVFTAAVEGSIAVDETEASAPGNVVESSEENAETASAAAAPAKAVRFKPRIPGQKARREDPTVPAEALVEGAVFTGKVTTIQPFGAFVNFGAFTDGLVHISKMSTGYVSNVSDIVKLGQEVKVTILNVEQSSGRIALSMVDKEEKEAAAKEAAAKTGDGEEGTERSRFQQGPDGRPVNRGRIAGSARQNRRDEYQKPPTKLSKGQEVEGTVKNKIRSGVFVELPKNEEGFLRYSDIPGGENMAPESSLQTGENIKATVLRIDRGKIILTMKPIVDISSVNRDINQGKDSGATNPFEIAFRAFNLIPVEPAGPVEEDVPEKEIAFQEAAAVEEVIPDAAALVEGNEADVIAAVEDSPVAEEKDVVPDAPVVEASPAEEEAVGEAPASVDDVVSEATATAMEEDVSAVEEAPVGFEASALDDIPAGSVPETEAAGKEAPVAEEGIQEAAVVVADSLAAVEEAIPKVAAVVKDSPAAVEEVSAEEQSVAGAATAPVAEEEVASEAIAEVSAAVEDSPAAVEDENPTEKRLVRETAAPVAKQEFVSEAATTPIVEEPVLEKGQVGVSAAIVKQLRDETGAGMMDCKRALAATGGDIEKARETLRKRGLASAEKKASRITSEGLIGSYIHDSRIGVLLEVNCETDFVSRGPVFKSLVEDLGMQVVASQQVQYVCVEDIPAEVVDKEKELEAQREDLVNKPGPIRTKIVDGRVWKRLNELALLEQPYIRDDEILVKDFVKRTVATLGENIQIRRFERYVLGEGLQQKGTDFAAEVATQKAVKAPAEAPKKAEEAPPAPLDSDKKVFVSAIMVKELRDQTGAGMMDCKKALASTGNDLAKAVEFLRKKGLASADKKASRLASEGLIGTYIHDGRIGILVEVNCETDFVARGERFKELVDDLAMQIAAYPQVEVVSLDDVPADVLAKERELESGKEDLARKPEAIRAKIVDGRVAKRLAELALLEQPYIKDDMKLVRDVVKEAIASVGENIQVRRFTRFNLGEGRTSEDAHCTELGTSIMTNAKGISSIGIRE
ncbi:unnamed protein product [Calypogeia fissa]